MITSSEPTGTATVEAHSMDTIKMLSTNDDTVLSQIFDPESAPTAGILVDSALPDDPHVTDAAVWMRIKQHEKAIILGVEAKLKDKHSTSSLDGSAKEMQQLINLYPDCACLLNDYAQILRLIHGNDLVNGNALELTMEVYNALDKAITLLNPVMVQATVSPSQCHTLAQAYTQRGALLLGIAKTLTRNPATKFSTPFLAGLTSIDLQEAASRDFFMGGRYGNEVGKALAVHTNPTAKLCGQMVQNAMRQELATASI